MKVELVNPAQNTKFQPVSLSFDGDTAVQKCRFWKSFRKHILLRSGTRGCGGLGMATFALASAVMLEITEEFPFNPACSESEQFLRTTRVEKNISIEILV